MVNKPRLEGLTDWRPLARGGFAVVWEARQESLNRLVAVKIITRKLDNPEERDRFLRETTRPDGCPATPASSPCTTRACSTTTGPTW